MSEKRHREQGGASPNNLVGVLFPNVCHDSILVIFIFAVPEYLTKVTKGSIMAYSSRVQATTAGEVMGVMELVTEHLKLGSQSHKFWCPAPSVLFTQ